MQVVVELEDAEHPGRRRSPNALPIVEMVLIAGLGGIAFYGFSHITSGYVEYHCETQSCADRLQTGRSALLTVAIVAPVLAVALGLLARYGGRPWRWIMWTVFVVGLIAICAFGIWLASTDDVQNLGIALFSRLRKN